MARRIVSMVTLTPTAFADATNLTANTYPFIVAGSTATQLVKVWEVSITGQAPSTSSPCIMLLSRDSTIASGTNTLGGGQTDAPMDPATAALTSAVVTGNSPGTTAPQRSATAHLLNLSMNAYGGVAFWRANRLEECTSVVGNTAPLGEVSLSAFTGGSPGLIGSHLVYEPL